VKVFDIKHTGKEIRKEIREEITDLKQRMAAELRMAVASCQALCEEIN
jgi:uncharacterized protein YaaR (DUF327 family)